jgi:uncharacterized membrane protein
MKRVLVSAIAVTFVASAALAASAMSEKEMSGLLNNGKEITLGGPSVVYSGHLSLNKDGSAHGQVKLQDGTVIPIDGVWRLSGNKFCRTWKAGRDAGKEICETWNKAGKNSVHAMNGKKDLGVNSW